MSDLISRSELLKEIENWGGCVEALHEYIQNMPTAYDIGKVVEDLDEYITKIVGRKSDLYHTIMQIVKGGGKYEIS